MPYERTVRLQTPLVSWHDITLLESAADWSIKYRAASPRMLIPWARWIECDVSGHRFFCDTVSPLWLSPDHEYRMRQPWVGQRSVVLILNTSPPTAPARRPVLPARTILRLARCATTLDSQRPDGLAIEELLIEILQTAWDQDSRVTLRSRRAIERARELIASRPEGNESLAEIAAVSHCSPFHLVRQFRRVHGVGVHGYRTRLRMSIALDRIRDGVRDFSALAHELGYSSHSHFSAAFRRSFSAAPQEVRTNLTAHRAH